MTGKRALLALGLCFMLAAPAYGQGNGSSQDEDDCRITGLGSFLRVLLGGCGGSDPNTVAATGPNTPAPIPPPPPPPPPPPAPAPAPAPVCNTGPYIVFFDEGSSAMSQANMPVLQQVMSAYASCTGAGIWLAGHDDTSGTAAESLNRSAARAAAVSDFLVGLGIPANRISSDAFGESQPMVPTGDGVAEAQNRRVEIIFGPGPDM